MPVTGAGILMANLTHIPMALNGTGGEHAWWADAPITGAEFLCASAQKISSAEVLMAWATTGPLAMKISNPITIKLTGSSAYSVPMKASKMIRMAYFCRLLNLASMN